jgi:methylthioribulose-1-phosphate dehydratase
MNPLVDWTSDRATWAPLQGLIDVGRLFHDRGWSVGTSSNYSCVLDRDPLRLVITASGLDKGRLTPTGFVVIDGEGRPISPQEPKPSAETLLHAVLARQRPGVGAVLHTHSIWNTLLSDRYFPQGEFRLTGYEMLKGLTGVTTHEHGLRVKIYENTQDIPALARQLQADLATGDEGLRHGFLLRRHGLYTWGQDLEEARRHIEIFEFLFEVHGRGLLLPPG